MKRLLLTATLAALGAAVSLNATTFGVPDGNRHPYVGTIILRTAAGYYSCSATLMSPTVLLTAGHCTEQDGIANLQTWATFSPAISLAGRANYASLADFLNDPANGWITGTALPHPQFDDFNQFPVTYDVGVVLLDRSVMMSTYGALPPLDFLRTIRSAKDNLFTVVGYGLQGYIPPFFDDNYERYLGQVRLVELNSTFNAGQSAKFTNNPGHVSGGSCYGDSGGPVFYDNSNVVVAVVSWGNTPCIGVDYQFRVDTAVAQSFVAQFLGN